MNGIRKAFFAKPLAVYLAAALIAASAFAGPAEAMYLSPGHEQATDALSADRKAAVAAIQKTLETEVIRQRLADLGLSSGEVLAKLAHPYGRAGPSARLAHRRGPGRRPRRHRCHHAHHHPASGGADPYPRREHR